MQEEKTVDKSMLVARKVVEDLLPNKAAVNVGVDLRRGEIRMAKHHLNGLRLAPPSSKWVAKVWRSVCGLMFFVMPASAAYIFKL